MDYDIIDAVLDRVHRGARVYFGRNHYGQRRIKIKHGPLHLRTIRHDTDPETFDEIRRLLRADGHRHRKVA